MDAATKQRWIEALRSGRYQQGYTYLSRTDSSKTQRFCCLGVLCDVLQVPYEERQDNIYKVRHYGLDRASSYLPSEVTEASEITEECFVSSEVAEKVLERHGRSTPYPKSKTGQISLTIINDSGITFDIIADIIEEAL